ncbi:MAG: hypothetical protein KTR27_09720 [Leptolyngbyaceae cyanobacterium MAG.088]|nr:hypothetical protein [Leptolyngbyaceae cyanobacterium MAG.088]
MNFGTPVPLLVGLILILGAVGLFFLDKFKPGYERSSDKVYSVLLLVSGIFLMAHLDMPLLASFQQVMLVGMLTTMIINDISKRESNRNTPRSSDRDGPPRRYEERPRRVYRAELDDWDTPAPPRIPSDRYRNEPYGERYEPRPLEPRNAPYDDRRPPARLQPSQQGREQFDNYGGDRNRPDARPSNSFYNNPRYDKGGPSGPINDKGGPSGPNNRPQQPPEPPIPTGNGAGHSLGGNLPQPPRNSDPRNERPPINVRPRPKDANPGNYTDFRPAPPEGTGSSEPYSETPPQQPPANY